MCALFLKPANNFHSHPHFTEEETESVGSEMMYSANYSIKIAFECGALSLQSPCQWASAFWPHLPLPPLCAKPGSALAPFGLTDLPLLSPCSRGT